MSDIKEALELVRSKESEASAIISRAMEKKNEVLRQAVEKGGQLYSSIISDAEEQAARRLKDGKIRAEEARLQILNDANVQLEKVEKQARNNFNKAISYLLDLFKKDYVSVNN